MTRPLVSIVIPVYNGADYLAQAIDSALAQTYPEVEVVVVNDGSTDGGATEAIARGYGERIRYFAKPNGRVASALNFGIRQMRGEYFSWLSHDDLYFADKVEAQMALMEGADGHTVVYSDFEVLDAASGARTPVRLPHVDPAHFRPFITLQSALHGCTLLIPRRRLEEAGPFDETLRTTQDYDMWFRLSRRCRFVHLPRVLVTGRSHAGQDTHRLRELARAECDRLLEGFVHGLAPEEVAAAAGARPARAYLSMAFNLESRGFAAAAGAARGRSREMMRRQPRLARLGDSLYVSWHETLRPVQAKTRKVIDRLARELRRLWRHSGGVKRRFSGIYRHNVFGGSESRSGVGSSIEQTGTIRRELPALLRELGVRTMMDAPCGDFFWMQHSELGIERYIGVDIVEELIARDQARYGSPQREFRCLDIIEDALPKADLIFCRDCLVHLNFAQAKRALRNFQRSGARYLLTTTFTAREANVDLGRRDLWRTLNLQRAPFNLPAPLRLINEHCTEGNGGFADKSLGLWALQDLSLD